MTVQHLPGSWIDVSTWIDGRLLAVTSDGPIVRCYLEPALVNPQPIWQQTAPESLLYLRQAVQGNLCLSVSQGHDSGQAWLIGEGLARSLGATFGVQPCGIDAHEVYMVYMAGHYKRLGLVSQPYPFPPGVPPDSSQGLSDVQPDGTLWWADLHRTVVIGGVTFTYPNERWLNRGTQRGRLVTVGQVDPPGIAAAVEWIDEGSGLPHVKVTRVIEGDAYEPHVAVSPTGRVAICARTDKGAAYVSTSIQELSA